MSIVVAPRRRQLVLALMACLVMALGSLFTSSARASSPTAPVAVVIDSVSGIAAPSGTPGGAVPYALVKAGENFVVTVSFRDSSGRPAYFNSDTPLTVTSTAGTLVPANGVALGKQYTASITTKLQNAANRVGLTVTVASGQSKGVTSGAPRADQLFDVLSDVRFADSSSNFQQGIGGSSNCADATSSAPVCGIVVLPRGAGSNVLLSVGACDADTNSSYAPCFAGPKRTGGAVVQTLFAQPGDPYTATSPATVVVKCDKSLCGTGPIQDLKLAFSFNGNDNLTDAGPCPAKGVAIAATSTTPAQPCVDYVQSKRDGSGDTHLFFLTPGDLRIGIG